MKEWRKVKLGDCCEITSSKRCLASIRTKEGIPFSVLKKSFFWTRAKTSSQRTLFPKKYTRVSGTSLVCPKLEIYY